MKSLINIVVVLVIVVAALLVLNVLYRPRVKNAPSTRTWGAVITGNLLTILLSGVALAILIFGLYGSGIETPSLARVGAWGPKYWLLILLLWGIATAIVALNATALGKAAGILQTTLAIAAFMLVIGFPAMSWVAGWSIWGPAPPRHAAAAIAPATLPLASWPVAEWAKVKIAPGTRTTMIPVPRGMRMRADGPVGSYRLVNVYRDGRECPFGNKCEPGPLAGMYIRNLSASEEIVVAYAFDFPP